MENQLETDEVQIENQPDDQMPFVQRFAMSMVLILAVFFLLLVFSIIFTAPLKAQTNTPDNRGEFKIFTKYFSQFPAKVQRVLTDSIVGVDVSYSEMENGKMTAKHSAGTGFVTGDGVVTTALHTVPDATDKPRSPVLIRVYDGKNIFRTSMIGLDSICDLVAVSIDPGQGGRFTKKPVTLATAKDKNKMPKHFYSFKFLAINKGIYFPIEFGRYMFETNLIEPTNNAVTCTYGAVSGVSEIGFSGAPLIGPDGKVYGLLDWRSDAFVYVILSETLADFSELVNEVATDQKAKKN